MRRTSKICNINTLNSVPTNIVVSGMEAFWGKWNEIYILPWRYTQSYPYLIHGYFGWGP